MSRTEFPSGGKFGVRFRGLNGNFGKRYIMTLYEFNSLEELEKNKALQIQGTELVRREEGEFVYILHGMGDFYVEAKYQTQSVIQDCKAFTSQELLDPFLGDIDISDV